MEEPDTYGNISMDDVKKYGTAGTLSYVITELIFWAVAFPSECIVYLNTAGHWPDFSKPEDRRARPSSGWSSRPPTSPDFCCPSASGQLLPWLPGLTRTSCRSSPSRRRRRGHEHLRACSGLLWKQPQVGASSIHLSTFSEGFQALPARFSRFPFSPSAARTFRKTSWRVVLSETRNGGLQWAFFLSRFSEEYQ
eukprot:s3317_g1.t1